MIDMSGKTFGRLTVISKDSERDMWLCSCSCGAIKKTRGKDMRQGKTKSCGCFQMENISNLNKTHGETKTRMHRIWIAIKSRCLNQNNKDYCNYGGRGIGMHDDWINSYVSFRDWSLLNGYADNLSMDRIDNENGYFPDNCRWTTAKVQGRNRRDNVFLELNGVSMVMSEWCEIFNIPTSTLSYRINMGWSPSEAIMGNKRR